MAVTTVGVTSIATSGTSHVLTTPTGVASGDLLLAIFGLNGSTSATWTPPTGWTLLCSTTAGFVWLRAYSRIADGTEGSSFTWTTSAFEDGGAGILALRGVDGTTPVLASSAEWDTGGGGATTFTYNSVSWTGAAPAVSVLLTTWQSSTATPTWPSGWNSATDGFTNNDTAEWLWVASNLTTQSSGTSLPSQTATLSTAELGETFQIALKVAGGSGHTQTVTASQAVGVAMTRTVAKQLIATQAVGTALSKGISKPLACAQGVTLGMSRAIGKAITAAQPVTAGMTKRVTKVLTASVGVAPALATLKSKMVLLSAAQAVGVSLTRAIAKQIRGSAGVLAGVVPLRVARGGPGPALPGSVQVLVRQSVATISVLVTPAATPAAISVQVTQEA